MLFDDMVHINFPQRIIPNCFPRVSNGCGLAGPSDHLVLTEKSPSCENRSSLLFEGKGKGKIAEE